MPGSGKCQGLSLTKAEKRQETMSKQVWLEELAQGGKYRAPDAGGSPSNGSYPPIIVI